MALFIVKNSSNFNLKDELNNSWDWILKVYEWPRSLMNVEYLNTLNSIQDTLGKLKFYNWNSDARVGDWTIPKNWIIGEAYIATKEGKKLVDISDNNLHVSSYSKPVSKLIKFTDLKENLHFSTKYDDAIPYLTHYYSDEWSFCVTKNQFDEISKYDELFIKIDSKFERGKLTVGELAFKGQSKKQINFNTYLCHPSLANNELSGPAVSILVAKYLEYLKGKNGLRYSYFIYWEPETIGAVALLSLKKDVFKENMLAGYVLTCLGDNSDYGYIGSRKHTSLSEIFLKRSLKKNNLIYKEYPFSQGGSDERQFCWSGVDLPYTCIFRSKFDEYDEYHTSKDNLDFISKEGLSESFKLIASIIDDFENSFFPISNTIGEPFLSQYLDYGIPGKTGPNKNSSKIREFLCYCDGETELNDIAKLINIDYLEAKTIYNSMIDLNLVIL